MRAWNVGVRIGGHRSFEKSFRAVEVLALVRFLEIVQVGKAEIIEQYRMVRQDRDSESVHQLRSLEIFRDGRAVAGIVEIQTERGNERRVRKHAKDTQSECDEPDGRPRRGRGRPFPRDGRLRPLGKKIRLTNDGQACS